MNKGFKNFLIICVVLSVIGLVLMGVGYALGGKPNVSIKKEISFNDKVINETKDFDNMRDIEIDTDLYHIEFIPSTQYKVEYSYNEGLEKPEVRLEEGKLYIKSENNDDKINTSLLTLFNDKKQELRLKIYYPEGEKLGIVKINNALGKIDIDELDCESLFIDMSAGDVEIKNTKVGAFSVINLDLGNLYAENLEIGSLRVDMDKGNVDIDGKIGSIDIECDMGSVDVETTLKKEEYNCSFKVDLGSLTIDGKDSEESITSNYNEAQNNMTITCDMGDIDVDFGK